MKRTVFLLMVLFMTIVGLAQEQQQKPMYDTQIDPMVQIDKAVAEAKSEGKYVVCQVGGNWCKWCRWFGKFIKDDQDIAKVINDNFVYIHVNYTSAKDAKTQSVIKRLKNPGRFGFPVLVILDGEGNVIHTQASNYLEEGEGYNKEKVLKFFQLWTPKAVGEF